STGTSSSTNGRRLVRRDARWARLPASRPPSFGTDRVGPTRRGPRARALLFTCTVLASRVGLAQNPAPPASPQARISELRAIAAKGPAGAAELTEALKDTRAPVRAAAIQLLAQSRGAAAARDIAPLTADPEDAVAVAAVSALLGFGGDLSYGAVEK